MTEQDGTAEQSLPPEARAEIEQDREALDAEIAEDLVQDGEGAEVTVGELWDDFHRAVNMTSGELRDWLMTAEAGETTEAFLDRADDRVGEQVLHVLGKRRGDLTDEDVAVMERVVDTVRQERGEDFEDLDPVAGDEEWRRGLMRLGHDPLKPAGGRPGERSL